MKRLLIATLVSGLSVAPMAFADDSHHPEKNAPATTGVTAAAPTPAPMAQTTQRMQDNVKRMQAQIDRVAKAKDDKTRNAALAEHMQTMRENMAMGQSMMPGEGGVMAMMGGQGGMAMMGGGMMEQCMKMMGGESGGAMGAMGGMPDRMAQMEKRMDMMQMMMQQMNGRGMSPDAMKPDGMKQ